MERALRGDLERDEPVDGAHTVVFDVVFRVYVRILELIDVEIDFSNRSLIEINFIQADEANDEAVGVPATDCERFSVGSALVIQGLDGKPFSKWSPIAKETRSQVCALVVLMSSPWRADIKHKSSARDILGQERKVSTRSNRCGNR